MTEKKETVAQDEAATYDEQAANAASDAEYTEAEAAAPQNGEDADEQTGDDLTAELERLRHESQEHQQRYLRTQADFDNFRRRSRQEKEEHAKYASAKLIEQLLPIVDNFERALAAAQDNQDVEALTKGIEMTYRQLAQVLEQEGLSPIGSVGEPFNPELHQAIMQVDSEEHEEGTVVEEVLKGYKLKDKILRPAMVKVAR